MTCMAPISISNTTATRSAPKDAVSLFQRYGKGGDNPGLKNWAAMTSPALERHLEMAQNLNK